MGEVEELGWGEDGEDFNAGRTITGFTTVVGLVSSMIGIAGMFLPIMGMQAGWFTSFWTNLVVAFLTYYTASLMVSHLGTSKNIKASILNHFQHDHRYMQAYGFVIWLSVIPFLLVGFHVTVLLLEGLLGTSPWIAPGLILFCAVLLMLVRSHHFMEEVMAMGVISLVLFTLFMIWALITAPSGPKTVPANGPFFALTATLVASYQIHDYFIQNIIKNPERHKYQSILKWTFGLGFVMTVFSCIAGIGNLALSQLW
jgi:hypothetical protein